MKESLRAATVRRVSKIEIGRASLKSLYSTVNSPNTE